MKRIHYMQIAAALVVAGAVTAGSHFLRPAAPTACDPTRDIFIAREHWVPRPQGGGTQFDHVVLSKFDPDATPSEVELGTIRGYRVTYAYDRAGRIFLYSNTRPDGSQTSDPGALHEYSICTRRLQPILTLPETSRRIDSARYVGDGATLLVVTGEITDEPAAKDSRLEVYRDGARSRSVQVSEQSPQYAGVSIDGVTPDGEVAYLSEIGADAGDYWGAYYRWQSKTDVVQKLGDFSGGIHDGTIEYMFTNGYYHGALNPSATRAVRVRRGKFEKDDLEPSNSGCIKQTVFQSGKYDAVGEELVLRDMSTGEDRVIYRNLTRVKSRCLDERTSIETPGWRDDRNVAFVLPNGNHTIDVETGRVELVSTAQPKSENMAGVHVMGANRIEAANDEYLFIRAGKVVHVTTGNIVLVPGVRPGSPMRFMLPGWTAVDHF